MVFHFGIRNFVRKALSTTTWWRLFVTFTVTLVHDIGGFFSAMKTVQSYVNVFPDPVSNLLLVFIPIGIVDVGSEALLLLAHDLPLCRKEEINKTIVRIGLAGQVMTVLSWLILAIFVLYDALVDRQFGIGPGLTEVSVVAIVMVKNALIPLAYNSRAFLYPIICEEQLLFLHLFNLGQPKEIISTFAKFQKLEAGDDNYFKLQDDGSVKKEGKEGCFSFTSKPSFHVITSFIILVVFDLIGIVSVMSVFNGYEIKKRILLSLQFLPVIIADIASETIILFYHDLVLCKGEDTKSDKTQKLWIDIARVTQFLVAISWVILLGYLVYSVSYTNKCTCSFNNSTILTCNVQAYNQPGGFCTVKESTQDPHGFCVREYHEDCLYNNITTIQWVPAGIPPSNTNVTGCSDLSQPKCEGNYPTFIDCVILGVVVFNNLSIIPDMYLRAHIYPITIPEDVMFLYHWDKNKKTILLSIGKMEFGTDFGEEDLKRLIEKNLGDEGFESASLIPLEGQADDSEKSSIVDLDK